jgi:hypothetical protein
LEESAEIENGFRWWKSLTAAAFGADVQVGGNSLAQALLRNALETAGHIAPAEARY